MTKLLEQAIAKARELSEAEQDAIADALFAHFAGGDDRYRLSAEQAADVSRIRDDLRSGRTSARNRRGSFRRLEEFDNWSGVTVICNSVIRRSRTN